jgi:hypothetical protein
MDGDGERGTSAMESVCGAAPQGCSGPCSLLPVRDPRGVYFARRPYLTACHDALVRNEAPRRLELPTVAALVLRAEAGRLGGERDRDGPIGSDAEAIRSSLGGAKRPAAAARGLVANVADHLGALGPVGLAVERIGDGHAAARRGRLPHLDGAVRDGVVERPFVGSMDTAQRLGGTDRLSLWVGYAGAAAAHVGRGLY